VFRAVLCSSSGGHIVLLQHLVSSFSVNRLTVHRVRAVGQKNIKLRKWLPHKPLMYSRDSTIYRRHSFCHHYHHHHSHHANILLWPASTLWSWPPVLLRSHKTTLPDITYTFISTLLNCHHINNHDNNHVYRRDIQRHLHGNNYYIKIIYLNNC